MKKILITLAIAMFVVTGCTDSREPNIVVKVIKVSQPDRESRYYVQMEVHTLLETLDHRRFIVAGDLGEPNDIFSMRKATLVGPSLYY